LRRGNRRIDDLTAQGFQRGKRTRFIATHRARIAGDICRDYGRQSALLTRQPYHPISYQKRRSTNLAKQQAYTC